MLKEYAKKRTIIVKFVSPFKKGVYNEIKLNPLMMLYDLLLNKY